MIYTVIVNDRSYDLPKKTISIAELLDKTVAVDTIKGITTKEKYQRVLDAILQLVGSENCADIFGSEELDEMDLSEITLTFRKIVDAYNKPVHEYDLAQSVDAINRLPIEKLVQLSRMTQATPAPKK